MDYNKIFSEALDFLNNIPLLITYIGIKPNNLDGTEEIIEIIDDKTISTAGRIFVKQ